MGTYWSQGGQLSGVEITCELLETALHWGLTLRWQIDGARSPMIICKSPSDRALIAATPALLLRRCRGSAPVVHSRCPTATCALNVVLHEIIPCRHQMPDDDKQTAGKNIVVRAAAPSLVT